MGQQHLQLTRFCRSGKDLSFQYVYLKSKLFLVNKFNASFLLRVSKYFWCRYRYFPVVRILSGDIYGLMIFLQSTVSFYFSCAFLFWISGFVHQCWRCNCFIFWMAEKLKPCQLWKTYMEIRERQQLPFVRYLQI